MSATPVVALVGPTAVGKTALALELAEAFGAEIVSADSRQVFRWLDVGTAKPTAAERRRAPHHLLDVVDPDTRFDAASFRRLALDAIADIRARGRAVIVCGGTGLYVRALLRGSFAGPAASPALRRTLIERERHEGPGTLHRQLVAADSVTASRLHPNDLVRIVRALEVLQVTGRPISAWQEAHRFDDDRLQVLTLGCVRPREELHARIEARCRAMIGAGLLDEIAALWRRGYGPELPPLQSVGYREMGEHVAGRADFATAFETFVRATRRLAKRQRTWFAADPDTAWLHPDRERPAFVARVSSFLTSWPAPTSTSSAPSLR
jgi:tRNA dimethylallyltransferase